MAILLISMGIGLGLGVGLTAPRKTRGAAPAAPQRVTADGSVRTTSDGSIRTVKLP
jgi:hypothetical protein